MNRPTDDVRRPAGSTNRPAAPVNAGEPDDAADDAVIGRALRGSAIVLAVLALGGGTAWFLLSGSKTVELREAAPVALPVERQAPRAAEIPVIPLANVTETAGIEFRHENGAAGEKLLPETMGGGCAFLDYDSDGDQDLLLVNSTRWPWDPRPVEIPALSELFENDGTGKYTNVTDRVGLTDSFYAQGVAVGDYDNDGDVDLYFSAVGQGRLYRQNGGRFVDVSASAGVQGQPGDWGTSCGWFDYDNDGDLDLFVAKYILWSREFDLAQEFQLTGGGRAYGRPQLFPGAFPALYRNEGNGTFKDVSEAAGLHITNANTRVPLAKSLGLTFADCDRDGWMDIIVANDTVQNLLFHNQKDGTFAEIGAMAGIAFDELGNARGAMGIDCSHFRNNDELGIAIGNFANEMTALYVCRGASMQFTDEAIATGLGPQSRLEMKFGTFFCDLDLDGRVDLVTANGHLEEDINIVQRTQHYEQSPHIFWNCGPDQTTEFVPVPGEKCGSDFLTPIVGRGAAYADIDGDGDLDLLLATTGREPKLYRNDQSLGHGWLRIKLEGTRSNRDAIGAVVTLKLSDGSERMAQVMPTKSYLSQCELPLTFGLGKEAQVKSLTVRWPGGTEQVVTDVPRNQLLKLREADGAASPTGVPPAAASNEPPTAP